MPSIQHSPLLRRHSFALCVASALPLIIGLGIAGTAQADTLINRGMSRLLYSGQLNNLEAFTHQQISIGSATALRLYTSSPDGLTAGPNTVADGDHDLWVGAISRDGNTVIGIKSGDGGPFIWTAEGGLIDLDTGISGNYRFDLVNDDGSAFAGTVNGEAFYWDGSTFRTLGMLGGAFSVATGLSGDGTTVVGGVQYIDDHSQGFVWRRGDDEMTGIGFLDGGSTSYASLVSYDGSVVGGMATNASGQRRAIRWTDGELTDLGSLEGGGQVELQGMNRDGSVLVGWSAYQPANQDVQIRAYRWQDGTMRDIHNTNFIESRATGVNDDGSVVVGTAQMLGSDGNLLVLGPGAGTVYRGFRWTNETGMITVDQWLRDNGVTLEEDITRNALFVSADGKTVVGNKKLSNDMYLAHVGVAEDGGEDPVGVIDVTNYVASAAQTNSVAIGLQTSSASTVMFGAQGSPMRNLLDVGRRSVWGTVDTGYDSGTKSEGAMALGDFGFGYGLMDGVTLRLQGGATYTDQDLYDGGDFQARGWYVAPEVTASLLGDLYLTVGGLYGRGALDINRGYLNGTALDYSNGETDTETLAGKVRVDWLNAVTLGDAAFTPYVALSRTLAKTDAYTETGGSFPASYDAVSEHATVARLGVDGVYRLNDTVTLLARAEAAYRFEEQSTGTSTEVAGVQLAVAGQDIKQFWLRGGVGTELAIGGGVASFMLNATTESDDPDIWLRSGWKVDF